VERRPVIDKNTGKAKVNANGEEVMTEAVITITSHTEPKEEVKQKAKSEDFLYIPSGAIISGVFLNGIDAPTGKSSQKNPFPTLIRIQKDAILPNYYTADIRECFLLMSGYGDLSSERAFLRGETISCIRSDGKIIDGRLDSYAVGDDGKAGVRGRLVSKQGQIIARSLLAGFAGGFAEMFDTTATPTLNTSSDGTIRYEDVYSSKAVKGGAAKGVSQALTRISDFYMDLAEAVYPVIEVDAGRQVDVVVSKGAKLTFKNVNSISTAKAESK
jgi:conjugal transfer pilus assembly protein TraB